MPAERAGSLVVAEPGSHYLTRPPLVVDCSAVAAVLFDEPNKDAALQTMQGKQLFAPELLDHEFVSVAIKKATLLPESFVAQSIEHFLQLRLTRCTPDMQAQWRLARAHQLTAYDAAYLQLAVELNAPLATLDRRLGEVAVRVLASR